MRASHAATYLLLCSCVCGVAQTVDDQSLNQLLENLPAVAHANKLDLPLYGVKIDEAYKRNPAALEAAVPLLAKNLSNKEPSVQLESVVLVEGLAMESRDPKFLLHFTDQLAVLMVSGDEYTRGAAIGAVWFLGKDMPDNVVQSLLVTLRDKNTSDRLLTSAVGVLLLARPDNTRVEDAYFSALDDPERSQQNRCQLLFAAGGAESLVGQRVVDRIVRVVNASPEEECRDAAIGAAERVGLRALDLIVSKLRSIEGDPNESKESRETASRALNMQLHGVR